MLSISAVSKLYDISTRTLRYYEQIGLLRGERLGPNRAYDDGALCRLRQILLLRRLCVPLKRVSAILDASSAEEAIALLRETIHETESELLATQTLQQAQYALLHAPEGQTRPVAPLLDDAAGKLFPSLTKPIAKEDLKMNEIKPEMTQANRLMFLPPITVACVSASGQEPEDLAFTKLFDFVRATRLWEAKPDLRVFGFNNPSIPNEKGECGYEYWVTVPEDWDVPAPLGKRSFEGGWYAAHCINMGDFHEWKPFTERVQNSDEYEYDTREPAGMWGGLEEHLNAYAYFLQNERCDEHRFEQLDLLLPIRKKAN